PVCDRDGAAGGRNRDVVHRCAEQQGGGGGRGRDGRTDSHVAHGRDEFAAGGVDWGVPDFVGGVSGDVAVDVHDRGGAGGGDVACERAGVFVFAVDPVVGDGDGVHAVE